MKQLSVLFTLLVFQYHHLTAQTLFTYGKKEVQADQFLRAFNKNPGEGNRQQAMQEYLPLYINYVLKVQDAYDKKLDTLPNQRAEVAMYKNQLVQNYLTEQAGAEKLIAEAIERLKQDVQIGHIYVAYGQGDSMAAGQKIRQAYMALKQGKPFGEVALTYSEAAEVQQNKGVPGWITGFVLPYIFESKLYALKQKGFTEPLAGSDGYHILAKIATRPAVGKVQVAQILLASFPGETAQEQQFKARLADSLYQLLLQGTPISTLATQYSQDRTSNQFGGVVPQFGVGTYTPVFEQAAFSLSTPGEVALPFKTEMGWHLIQLVKKMPPPAVDNLEDRQFIRVQIENDGRLELAKNQFITKLSEKLPIQQGNFSIAKLQAFTDTLLKSGEPNVALSTPLFTIGKEVTVLSDWMAFARVQANAGKLVPATSISTSYQAFVNNKKEEYVQAHLDEVDAGFAQQYREFKDANLLFEAMEQNVWSKAQSDTAGLRKYYMANASKYVWNEHAMAILVSSTDSTTAVNARNQMLQAPRQWRTLNETYNGLLFADSGRYELTMLPLASNTPAKPEMITPLVSNALDANYSFAYIIAPGRKDLPRTFEEARGYVISDYQTEIENRWLEAIKKKYPIKINNTVWRKVQNTVASSAK